MEPLNILQRESVFRRSPSPILMKRVVGLKSNLTFEDNNNALRKELFLKKKNSKKEIT